MWKGQRSFNEKTQRQYLPHKIRIGGVDRLAEKKYGVVYTPDSLADFVAELLNKIIRQDRLIQVENILDPACGEGALLSAYKKKSSSKINYIGIDVDLEATENIPKDFKVYKSDTILPKTKKKTHEYWKNKLPKIQAIIANPPWSSEKIYTRDELHQAGFSLTDGQYDSYVLFIELAYKLLQNNGYFAFIIPDSIFDAQNESLRRFLISNMQIKVIARLGEKLFENIFRATTVIICQKRKPTSNDYTICFRLSTNDRKTYLAGEQKLYYYYEQCKHEVLQSRFLANINCNFDIDARVEEESLISKIQTDCILWDDIFSFGRGVEISKTGEVTVCEHCSDAQGYTSAQFNSKRKICTSCQSETRVDIDTTRIIINIGRKKGFSKIIVGEDLHRYTCGTNHYIEKAVQGINYKADSLYSSPKLLVRKTGLGIYAAIDYSHEKTIQTVYILKYKKDNSVPLEYYLALLNSRVVYYYYLKTYGENEWKSHPYITKNILFSLPIKKYENSALDLKIIQLATQISHKYDYSTDLQLERLIMQKYNLDDEDINIIRNEMNNLPNLSSVNSMKMEDYV